MSFFFLNLLVLILSVLAQEVIYTVQQAQKCFHQKALASCQNVISECLAKKDCERQLHFFHDCNFDKEYENEIFNGNCFKNWNSTAVQSRKVIECLDWQCNLAEYNSQVSLPILYSCSTEALISQPVQCDQKCQQILAKQISQKIPYKPIRQIYSQQGLIQAQITHQSVLKIIELIRKECISQTAAIRKKHQSDLLNKKISKQKMIDRMNKKSEYDPSLNPETLNTPEKDQLSSDL